MIIIFKDSSTDQIGDFYESKYFKEEMGKVNGLKVFLLMFPATFPNKYQDVLTVKYGLKVEKYSSNIGARYVGPHLGVPMSYPHVLGGVTPRETQVIQPMSAQCAITPALTFQRRFSSGINEEKKL